MSKDCYYHRGEKLTNFCFNKQCSLPLCPRCIHDHLASPGYHHILSLDDMITTTKQSLTISIQGLQAQTKQLTDQLQPQKIHKQFVELIEKYRKQNIQQINLYYKNLQKQLLISIQSIHSQHLLPFQAQLEEKLKTFKKYYEDISKDQNLIPTLININFNNQLNRFQQLFAAFIDKRTSFKDYLPTLDLSDKGRLQIKVQSNYRFSRKTSNQNFRQTTRHPLQRISNLEDKLYMVRSRIMQ